MQSTQIVHEAEKRFGQRIYTIQDCAHSFEAEWQGKSVVNAGDGALFGLNISKQLTSIFGGMFSTNDAEIVEKLGTWRENNYSEKTLVEKFKRAAYLPAAAFGFNDLVYGITYWLQTNTSLLTQLTDAYHLDEKIHFPPDYLKRLSAVEAKVGLAQLKKYSTIKSRRRALAEAYFSRLKVPPDMDNATSN